MDERQRARAVTEALKAGYESLLAGRGHARAFDALRDAEPIVAQVVWMPGGRKQPGGHPLDRMAPTVWHAAAFLLHKAIISRFPRCEGQPTEDQLFDSFYGQRWLFRGQTSAWPWWPSAWRDTAAKCNRFGDQPRDSYQRFLAARIDTSKDPSLDMFDRLRSPIGVAATLQHYGFPTNLLDLTFDPLTALHFALAPTTTARATDGPDGHAVVSFVRFDLVHGLAPLTGRSPVLHLPPIQVNRVYRQIGCFVDFGPRPAATAVTSGALDDNAWRLYVPRGDPDAAVFRNPGLETEEPFFAESVAALRAYCEGAGADYHDEDVAAKMAALRSPPPWRSANNPTDLIWTTDEYTLVGLEVCRYLLHAALVFPPGTAGVLDPWVVAGFWHGHRQAFDALEEIVALRSEGHAMLTWCRDQVRTAIASANRRIAQQGPQA